MTKMKTTLWVAMAMLVTGVSTQGLTLEIGGSASAKAEKKSGQKASVSADASVEAERDQSAVEETQFYKMDMKPGLNYSKKNNALAQAARNHQAIRIGAKPKPQAETPMNSRQNKMHVVKEGDTLWDICEAYFGDPYVWPRVWSYNANITNPNWLFPGDTLWLVPPFEMEQAAVADANGDDGQSAAMSVAAMQASDAILHRNRGFVDKELLEQAGIIRGAQTQRELLAQFDEAYAEFKMNKDIQLGDEFAAYRILKDVEGVENSDSGEETDDDYGHLVEILGAVRVISFDKKQRIARVVIDESLRDIQRGTMIGPVHRRFEFVPTRTNNNEMKATVIAHLDNTVLFSKHQIAFVDKGSEDGVKEGNRFFAIEKRDNFKKSRDEDDAHPGFPYEVIAELRVLETRKTTSTCIVTGATREIEDGAALEMVKGY